MSTHPSVEQMIEDLAIAVGKGFQEMQARFERIEHDMRDGLERIDFNTSGLARRIDVLEDQMRVMRTTLSK